MAPLRVLLLQLPVPNNPVTNIPLAAGYLKAYAWAQGLLEHIEIAMLPRALVDRAGDALLVTTIVQHCPDVLGISLYTWNSERSLLIAQRVKACLPKLLVVVGGPEVQSDNHWVLVHPAVDVAVIGEGEQTFAELLRLLVEPALRKNGLPARQPDRLRAVSPDLLASIPGIAFSDRSGELVITAQRVPLSDLSILPSPYLLGYLELAPGDLLMIEISRWCPYACSFCLYGRALDSKLGRRYFPLDRISDEIRWGREQGVERIHFVEANLNLVPIFYPLMRALADLCMEGPLGFYAELRAEHLTEEAVAALAQAGLRVAEVGLQSANPAALKAVRRTTDLRKWAVGTRRLLAHGIEVYLDVILGLPADDAAGVAATLDFIQRENLESYDVFTLQVLPATGLRQQVEEYQIVYQKRPPYYVLATDRFSYADLRHLRCDLKRAIGLDPHEVEGCPLPRFDALNPGRDHEAEQDRLLLHPLAVSLRPIARLWLLDREPTGWDTLEHALSRLAAHVDIVSSWVDSAALARLLAQASRANPTTIFDCYLLADLPPSADVLRTWRAALPHQPSYLDRVAAYRYDDPLSLQSAVSPRLWLVVPWTTQVDPQDYAEIAGIIWAYDLKSGDEAPLAAWAAAGGAGVWVRGRSAEDVEGWRIGTGQRLWYAEH